MQLVVDNAKLFNPKDHFVHSRAEQLWDRLQKRNSFFYRVSGAVGVANGLGSHLWVWLVFGGTADAKLLEWLVRCMAGLYRCALVWVAAARQLHSWWAAGSQCLQGC